MWDGQSLLFFLQEMPSIYVFHSRLWMQVESNNQLVSAVDWAQGLVPLSVGNRWTEEYLKLNCANLNGISKDSLPTWQASSAQWFLFSTNFVGDHHPECTSLLDPIKPQMYFCGMRSDVLNPTYLLYLSNVAQGLRQVEWTLEPVCQKLALCRVKFNICQGWRNQIDAKVGTWVVNKKTSKV